MSFLIVMETFTSFATPARVFSNCCMWRAGSNPFWSYFAVYRYHAAREKEERIHHVQKYQTWGDMDVIFWSLTPEISFISFMYGTIWPLWGAHLPGTKLLELKRFVGWKNPIVKPCRCLGGKGIQESHDPKGQMLRRILCELFAQWPCVSGAALGMLASVVRGEAVEWYYCSWIVLGHAENILHMSTEKKTILGASTEPGIIYISSICINLPAYVWLILDTLGISPWHSYFLEATQTACFSKPLGPLFVGYFPTEYVQ